MPRCDYEILAELVEYPTEKTAVLLAGWLDELRASRPPVAELLQPLGDYLWSHQLESAQELYTRIFDLNPVCTLGIGYHLFGDSYERGRFMAELRKCEAEAGLVEERELPDHLSVVLKWLARVNGTDLYSDMVEECVLPALAKMDDSLAGEQNPYRSLLRAVTVTLGEDLTGFKSR